MEVVDKMMVTKEYMIWMREGDHGIMVLDRSKVKEIHTRAHWILIIGPMGLS